MVNVCKGTCVKFKAVSYEGRHRYENGQKMCPICEIFLIWDGIRCPCCTVILRITPRGNRARKEIHEKRNAIWH